MDDDTHPHACVSVTGRAWGKENWFFRDMGIMTFHGMNKWILGKAGSALAGVIFNGNHNEGHMVTVSRYETKIIE